MPRSLRDFWPRSIRCIDGKHFPFKVFHLNHSFYLCLEYPVNKSKHVYANDPDDFVTINSCFKDRGDDCIIMVIVSLLLSLIVFGQWSKDDRRAESFNLLNIAFS